MTAVDRRFPVAQAHDIRRPAVDRLAARLREANPTWTDDQCLAEAKARWTQEREADLAGAVVKRGNSEGMDGW